MRRRSWAGSTDTPLGKGNGIHRVGPGTMKLRFEKPDMRTFTMQNT